MSSAINNKNFWKRCLTLTKKSYAKIRNYLRKCVFHYTRIQNFHNVLSYAKDNKTIRMSFWVRGRDLEQNKKLLKFAFYPLVLQ